MDGNSAKRICCTTLSTGSCVSVNRVLLKELGITATLFLSELIDKFNKLSISRPNLEWFSYKQDEITESCGLSPDQQRNAYQSLIELNLIEKKRMGVPSRCYFTIKFEELLKVLCKDVDITQNGVAEHHDQSAIYPDPKTSHRKIPSQVTGKSDIDEEKNSINTTVTGKSCHNIDIMSNFRDSLESNSLFEREFSSRESQKFSITAACAADDTDQTSLTTPDRKEPDTSSIAVLPIVTKLRRRSYSSQISDIIEEASAGLEETQRILAEASRKHRVKKTPIDVPREVEDIMDCWLQSGMRLPDKERSPKSFNDTVRYLKKLQKGTLIPGETRKFGHQDIINVVVKFSTMALDQEYWPDNPEIKKSLAKMSLPEFIYCPYKKSSIKSWFLHCYDGPPLQKLEEFKQVEDKHPTVTNRLKSFFFNYALAGFKKKLTPKEECKFREASNKLCEIYDKFSHRFSGVDGYYGMADLLCESMRHTNGEQTTKVHPGSFPSSFSMSRMLAYMNENGYIPDADFNLDSRY